MSFNWSEYLILSQELTSKSTTSPIPEAHFRCAISRAYYAAFCNARNFLRDNDRYSPSGENVHRDVISQFERSSDTTRRYIGSLLHNLRNTRNIADYQDIFYGNQLGRTQAVLVSAEEVIQLLSTL